MRQTDARERAELLASFLAGIWRQTPPPLELSGEELDLLTSPLLGAGCGPLAWRRIRGSRLETPGAEALKQSYRYYALHAARCERQLEEFVALLLKAGVEPLLIKGWVAARNYPEAGLRPYGDIDLVVGPEQFAAAERVLKEATGYWVDLHRGFTKDYGLRSDEVSARARVEDIGGIGVRVPCPEDHLRILAIHLLRHGAWRPLWLCDVAAALESRAVDFDWARCLGEDTKVADRVACAVGLAHRLLGAEVEDTPVAGRAKRLPRWLVPAVLKQWERPYADEHEAFKLMSTYLRRPRGVWQAMRKRWPDPVSTTMYFDAPFDELPRLPLQAGNYVLQGAKFLMRLPGQLRGRR